MITLVEVQGAILDFLQREHLTDADGFASRAAAAYIYSRSAKRDPVPVIGRVSTSTFSTRKRDRHQLTSHLVARLDRRFAKRVLTASARRPVDPRTKPYVLPVPAALNAAAASKRFTSELNAFKKFVEARAVQDFWLSRSKGTLRAKPERMGQSLLLSFLSSVFRKPSDGTVLQEVRSGIGFVDVMAFVRTSEPLIAELKVLSSGGASGRKQLAKYLKTEGLTKGWLVIFDARNSGPPVVEGLSTDDDVAVTTIRINIRPTPPHEAG